MRLTTTLLLTTLLAVALLTGCSGSKASTSADGSGPADTAPVSSQAEGVAILGKVAGSDLNLTSYYLGVLDDAAVAQFNLAPQFAERGVALDLDQHSVVLFSLGEQTTAGFEADILAMQRKGNELFVQGTAAAPSPDAAVAQQITTPFCAVAVAKLPANLTVRSDITSLVE
ncbi:MAG: protease complex subunit PrcB family protein [Planctomycetota bacterium]